MENHALSRRKVLSRAATAALVVFVEGTPGAGAAGPGAEAAGIRPGRATRPRRILSAFANPPTKTVRVVRAADQMDVTLELFDVSVSSNQVSITGAQPAIRITFGSQHTVERMFEQASPSVPTTPVARIDAGDSVVVVPVSGTTPFTLDGVLDLAEAALTVQAAAGAPDGSVTALEIPTSLVISPAAGTTLTASRTAFTQGNTTELWVAKLRSDGDAVAGVAIANLSDADLVNRIPEHDDRDRIVENTTGPDEEDGPFQTGRLWLSSSGAFARIDGDWPENTLTRWRQRIATGRDLHVEIVTVGYLAPFGVRAAVTEVADREWFNDTGGGQTSVVRIRRYLTLMEEEGIFWFTRPYQPDEGRGLPFNHIQASWDETAQITLAAVDDLSSNPINGVYDINLSEVAGPLVVTYTVEDRDRHTLTFTLPTTFVDDDVAYNTGGAQAPAKFRAVYNGGRNTYRDIDLRGQDLAFADLSPGAAAGATTKTTYAVRFKLRDTTGSSTDLETNLVPAFSAALDTATVTDGLINASLGLPTESFEVTHHSRWISDGTEAANFDQSFLKLTVPKTGTVGGSGTPVTSVASVDLTAEVFNQTAGIGPDISSPSGTWSPEDMLGDGSRLLGSIVLRELIEAIASDLAVPGVDVPGTTVEVDGDTVTTVFSFEPTLNTKESIGFYAHPGTQCKVVVTTVASVSGGFDAQVITEMTASDFEVHFPPTGTIIEVDFERVKTTLPSAGAFTVDPTVSAWRLHDDLSFLQPIMDLLEGLGGLHVDISSDYIEIDVAINVPSVSLGMMRITNIHLDFDFGLPLGELPVTLHAGLGSPASPVEAKVGIFGGSFYLAFDVEFGEGLADWRVSAGVSGLVEFGFDAIVVSAAVRLRIDAEFVFNKTSDGESVRFTGSVSIEGEVNVFGLLEVSVALVGSVSYRTNQEVAVAKGEIQFGVDTPLGGVSGHVPLGAIEFELGDGVIEPIAAAGGPSRRPHPSRNRPRPGPQAAVVPSLSTFGDLYSQSDWNTYTGAFA